MVTLICSFFLLGCLAFLSWCNIVGNFECYIFGWILCMCVYCMYDWEYLGGALFPFCPVRQHDYFCLTNINDCYSPPHTLTLIPFMFLLPQLFTCTQSHWTNVHSESCEIKGFSTIKLQLSTSSRVTFPPYLLCSLQIFLPLIFFTLLINAGVVVISVPGRNTHFVFFSCMGNIGSSWVILPDGRPHVCWLKGNGRGMPPMPRQPGEATAEHIMPAWMQGPWHQV